MKHNHVENLILRNVDDSKYRSLQLNLFSKYLVSFGIFSRNAWASKRRCPIIESNGIFLTKRKSIRPGYPPKLG